MSSISGIKDCIVPHPYYSHIIAADYSQLEIMILAQLAGPGQLRDDIQNGVDIHTALLCERLKEDYDTVKAILENEDHPEYEKWYKLRKENKQMSFQLQYGASAISMARKLGLPKYVTEDFIKSYYGRYSEVKRSQQLWIETVKEKAKPSKRRTELGYPAKVSWLGSPTGRRYVFYETDSPEWLRRKGIMTSFNPPNIKNYPVQGFATGDLVPIAFSNLNDYIMDNDLVYNLVLANTVHDSIVGYVQEDFIEEAAQIVREIMEQGVPHYLYTYYGIELFMNLLVEVEVGKTMSTMRRVI